METKELNAMIAKCINDIVGPVDYEELGRQIVGETILAILAADTRDMVFTTYDINFRDAIIARVVDSVRNHWNFA